MAGRFVDRGAGATNPNYGLLPETTSLPSQGAIPGGNTSGKSRPAILYDATRITLGGNDNNIRVEFYTVAICRNPGKKGQVLGYVNWGW